MQFVVEPKQLKDIALLKYAGASVMVLNTPFFSGNALHSIQECEFAAYVEECKRLEVEVFVDVTRMFVDAEMDRLSAFLADLKQMNVDGIYFADLSVYEVARELEMEALCIYQPDTLITNSLDASLYLDFGIKAVSIAKELTLEEVCEIASANPEKIEVVVHGIPLMSVSKRKLISNYFEEIGFNGERKLFYHVTEEKRDARMPIFEDEKGTHMFGGYCLYSYKEIVALQQASVKYARIQGNFLDTIHVIYALNGYHAVLAHQAPPEEVMAKIAAHDPNQVYTSGFYNTKTSAKKEGLEI